MSYLQMAKEWEKKRDYMKPEETDPYKILFDKVVTELNKDYPADILPFLKDNYSQLYEAINKSEQKLDQLWGEAPIDEFREELKTFYRLNRKAVKIYHNQ